MSTRLLILTALLVALVLPAGVAGAQAVAVGEEEAFLQAINASRAEQGLGALVMNVELQGVARGWTGLMAGSGSLAHNPSYRDQYTGEWHRLGENVGYTSGRGSLEATVAHLHQAFLNSSGHRANIMGAYNQVGIGAAYDAAGKLWVTVNFLDGPVPAAEEAQYETEPEQPRRAAHYGRRGI